MINKIFVDTISSDDYFICTYYIQSSVSLHDAAWNIAIGQSIGNPLIRNKWETDELISKHSALVFTADEEFLKGSKSGFVEIAFPVVNINLAVDGVSQLLCQVMGGQMDIDSILACRLVKINFPPRMHNHLKGPKFGLSGLREYTKTFDKPLLGAIIKPKIGMSLESLSDIVKELVDGGVNFIKEDEIMSSPLGNSVAHRVEKISKVVRDNNVVYCACINSDPAHIINLTSDVYSAGGNGVHVNIWSGLGSYKSIRDLDYPLFIHFQKSGDRVFTAQEHRFGIEWGVICYLASLMGVDTIHVGMIGGYKSDEPTGLKDIIDILIRQNVTPALSCGMHPGLVDFICKQLGNDWMANVGGAIHGHPNGTLAGARAMRQSIDKTYGEEYNIALETWGKK